MLNWLPGGAHVPIFYAQAAGFYKKSGIDAVIESTRGSRDAMDSLGSGKAQFAIAEATELFASRADDVKAVGVMAYFGHSPNAIFTLKRPDISSLSDLNGMRIAAPRSSFPRIMFPALKTAGKVNLKKISWVNLSPRDLLPALITGKVDAVASSLMNDYQYRAAARRKGKDITPLPFYGAGVNPYSLVLATPKSFINKNPKLAKAFVHATAKGMAAALERPEAALKTFIKLNPAADPSRSRAEWRAAHKLMYRPGSGDTTLGKFDRNRVERMRIFLTRIRNFRNTSTSIDIYSNDLLPILRPQPTKF
ncbi:MAG: ABC transporter substrate-binding protein [Nitrospinaceae bacterium]|nr:ABC transporter substrate-binding protein [Nitrospinaceae bacterium]MBT7857370.1 ABC transporter substrate-binding protein [Nitrospinaceae bacterium]